MIQFYILVEILYYTNIEHQLKGEIHEDCWG